MLCPQSPIAFGTWRLRPLASLETRLSCTNLLTTSFSFDTLINLFDLRFSSFLFSKSWLHAKADPQLLIFHFLSHKSLSFWKFLMTLLHVIYGLAPPLSKILAPHIRGGVEDKSRGQGQGHKKNPRSRPRTAFPRTDPLEAKDRNARGQGQGPRTQAQAFSKKKGFKNFFQAISNSLAYPGF